MVDITKPQLDPLKWNSKFATKDGYATPEFIRLWNQMGDRAGNIPWNASSMSALLDLIGTTSPGILIRGATQWAVKAMSQDGTLAVDGKLTVKGIQGRAVASTAPSDKQIFQWDNAGSQWAVVTVGFVPAGGTTGQVLAKNSNTDYDTHWVDAAAGSTPYGSFIIDGTDYYVATVISLADPRLVTLPDGSPVYVKNPGFTP